MGSSTGIHEQAMSRIFGHMMSDDRLDMLFGEGPERALDSYQRFSTERVKPSVIIEMPLVGDPGYDVLTGNYQRRLLPGGRLLDSSQTAAQDVVDWVARWSERRHC